MAKAGEATLHWQVDPASNRVHGPGVRSIVRIVPKLLQHPPAADSEDARRRGEEKGEQRRDVVAPDHHIPHEGAAVTIGRSWWRSWSSNALSISAEGRQRTLEWRPRARCARCSSSACQAPALERRTRGRGVKRVSRTGIGRLAGSDRTRTRHVLREPDGRVALGSLWEMTVTVAGPVATLAALAKGCQRGVHGGRGDVARVSGRASRARRRLSELGGVASDRGRLRRQGLQSWCLRNPYGSVVRRGKIGLGKTM